MKLASENAISVTFSQSVYHPIHVYGVGDAIQQSHPLSSPSPHAFNLSQDQPRDTKERDREERGAKKEKRKDRGKGKVDP